MAKVKKRKTKKPDWASLIGEPMLFRMTMPNGSTMETEVFIDAIVFLPVGERFLSVTATGNKPVKMEK